MQELCMHIQQAGQILGTSSSFEAVFIELLWSSKINVVKHFNSKGLVTSFLKKIILYLFILYKNIFIYLFLVTLGLCCCTATLAAMCGLLAAVASLVAEQGLQASGLQQLRLSGSRAQAQRSHGLSFSVACGIFPDQGSNLCLLYWQEDSLPLSHQGSPHYFLLIFLFHTRGSFSDDVVFLQLKESFFYCFLDSVPCLFSF